jgi:hypothetical protein
MDRLIAIEGVAVNQRSRQLLPWQLLPWQRMSWQTLAVFGYAMVSCLAVNDAIKVAKSLVMSSSKRLAAADLSSRLVI